MLSKQVILNHKYDSFYITQFFSFKCMDLKDFLKGNKFSIGIDSYIFKYKDGVFIGDLTVASSFKGNKND
jgi:hypothetical protein